MLSRYFLAVPVLTWQLVCPRKRWKVNGSSGKVKSGEWSWLGDLRRGSGTH